MYKVVIEQRATKEIESFPNEVIQEIIDSIQRQKQILGLMELRN